MANIKSKLVVAVSSQALFNCMDGDAIYKSEGGKAFDEYHLAKLDIPLRPGVAFPLVKKLLALNTPGLDYRDNVEVVLLSRNSPVAGTRVMKSVQYHKLDIERAQFSQGGDRFAYAKVFGADLFLSTNPSDVKVALENGMSAATLWPHSKTRDDVEGVIRVAFDGDSVLFSDEAEIINQLNGLEAFQKSEQQKAMEPLKEGPMANLLNKLHLIRESLPDKSLIRIGLVTARGIPAHERVLRTLISWGINIDEAAFLGGLSKGEFLNVFGADIFFDDTKKHCESASEYVPTGHIPAGITNQK